MSRVRGCVPGVCAFRVCAAAVLALAMAAGGCTSSRGVGAFDLWLAGDRLEDERLAAEHRERFHQSGSPESLRWLLAHRLSPGMSVGDVNQRLGQEGERIYDAGPLKRTGGRYHESDEFYKWGPDHSGRSVYLVFRDGRLLQFDPADFDEG